MKSIVVLLNGPIANDSRVIREIKTMAQIATVDLYYCGGNVADKGIFGEHVQLFNCNKPNGIKEKIIRHTCFYNEYMFYVPKVIEQNKNYDYIWANDLPDLKPALALKKKIRAKVIYDSHEIYIGTLNQFFPSKAKFPKCVLHKISYAIMTFLGRIAERKMVKHVDTFVTTSMSFKEYFRQKYQLKDVRIVMNCPAIQTSTDFFDFRKEFNLPNDSFILIFQGRLNAGRALMEMIEAFQYVNPNIHLFVLGDGTLKQNMINYSKVLSLQNMHFLNEVPSSELLRYTRGADVGINLQASINISKHLASANKLFEYTHAGIPTIGSDVPENKLIIEKYDIGVLVKNDPKDIANAINKMAKTDLSVYREHCKQASLEYNWENQEKVILEILK